MPATRNSQSCKSNCNRRSDLLVDLCGMFPTVDVSVINDLLENNRSCLERTCDQLLQLSTGCDKAEKKSAAGM